MTNAFPWHPSIKGSKCCCTSCPISRSPNRWLFATPKLSAPSGPPAAGTPVILRAGQQFVITTARVLGDSTRVSTVFKPLPREVHRGDRILLSDGLIELRVRQVRGREVICEVVNGGALGEHKGINLPGVKLRVPALTPKDREDLLFALKHGANYIAVSFVR